MQLRGCCKENVVNSYWTEHMSRVEFELNSLVSGSNSSSLAALPTSAAKCWACKKPRNTTVRTLGVKVA